MFVRIWSFVKAMLLLKGLANAITRTKNGEDGVTNKREIMLHAMHMTEFLFEFLKGRAMLAIYWKQRQDVLLQNKSFLCVTNKNIIEKKQPLAP